LDGQWAAKVPGAESDTQLPVNSHRDGLAMNTQAYLLSVSTQQGWGPRGLASTLRTKFCGLGLGLDDARPWLWLRGDLAV